MSSFESALRYGYVDVWYYVTWCIITISSILFNFMIDSILTVENAP